MSAPTSGDRSNVRYSVAGTSDRYLARFAPTSITTPGGKARSIGSSSRSRLLRETERRAISGGYSRLGRSSGRAAELRGRHEGARDLLPGADARDRHRVVELILDVLENGEDSFLAAGGQAPEVRTPDEHSAGAQRKRLEDIGAASHSSVQEHRDAPLHRVDDLRQDRDRSGRSVQL